MRNVVFFMFLDGQLSNKITLFLCPLVISSFFVFFSGKRLVLVFTTQVLSLNP